MGDSRDVNQFRLNNDDELQLLKNLPVRRCSDDGSLTASTGSCPFLNQAGQDKRMSDTHFGRCVHEASAQSWYLDAIDKNF